MDAKRSLATADPNDDDIVESIGEAAGYMGISISTLRRQIKAGTGPAIVRPSKGRIGIRRGDRRAHVLNSRVGGSPESKD